MTNLTPEHLAEIKARLEAATPGPWFVSSDDGCTVSYACVALARMSGSHPVDAANAALIAHAPTDIAALLAALAERDAEVARLRNLLLDEGLCPDCGAFDPNMWGPYGHETRCPKTQKTEAP